MNVTLKGKCQSGLIFSFSRKNSSKRPVTAKTDIKSLKSTNYKYSLSLGLSLDLRQTKKYRKDPSAINLDEHMLRGKDFDKIKEVSFSM